MDLKTIGLFVSMAAVSASAFAQTSLYGEVIEVRVTNVDVVVTGKDGKPVPGLKIEDFELYEDGAKKLITNFLEIREDAAPALTAGATATETSPAAAPGQAPDDNRRRQIVIFLDNAAIKPFHRNTVLPFVSKFVKDNIRKGDETAIITWAHSLKAELEPTTDFAAVEATLQRVAQQTASGSESGADFKQFQDHLTFIIRAYKSSGRTPPWSEGLATARQYAMAATQQTHQRVEALKVVAASMRGAAGRKILVFVTEGLSSNPGEPALVFLDSLKDQFEGVDVPAMSYAHDFEIAGLVRDVADAANSSGVTIYPIDVGGKMSGMDFADASESRIVSSMPAMIAQTASLTVNGIAAETGGVALYGSTNWKLAFDTIANDLNTYYSLGYRASGEKTDRLRKVVVRLTNKRYSLRTRHLVIEPSAASEMNDAVAAHLFRDVGTNDLAIRASAGTATPGGGESLVIPLTITIPTEKLTLLPDGTDLTGSFSVFAAFLRKDGAVSKVARQPQNFRFPAESLKRRKEITVKIDVKADARTDGISVGVLDEPSHTTGFASVKME
jgi:VWFA-related protein